MAYTCPHCGSDNTQSFPALHEAGSYTFSAGTSQHSGRTTLAQRAAPPQEATIGCSGWAFIIIALSSLFVLVSGVTTAMYRPHDLNAIIGGGFLAVISLLMLVVFTILAINAWRKMKVYNADDYQRWLAHWNRSVYCHRCGGDFVR